MVDWLLFCNVASTGLTLFLMKPSRFWMKSGILFIYGKALDTEIHKHNAIQIVWPAGLSKCLVGNHCIDHAVIIAEAQPHRLQMSQGWVLLIEPQSAVGEKLSKLLVQDKFKAIKDLIFFDEKTLIFFVNTPF